MMYVWVSGGQIAILILSVCELAGERERDEKARRSGGVCVSEGECVHRICQKYHIFQDFERERVREKGKEKKRQRARKESVCICAHKRAKERATERVCVCMYEQSSRHAHMHVEEAILPRDHCIYMYIYICICTHTYISMASPLHM